MFSIFCLFPSRISLMVFVDVKPHVYLILFVLFPMLVTEFCLVRLVGCCVRGFFLGGGGGGSVFKNVFEGGGRGVGGDLISPLHHFFQLLCHTVCVQFILLTFLWRPDKFTLVSLDQQEVSGHHQWMQNVGLIRFQVWSNIFVVIVALYQFHQASGNHTYM